MKIVCPRCKSENIVRDACATWNGTEWVLAGLYDNITCQDCNAEFYEGEKAE